MLLSINERIENIGPLYFLEDDGITHINIWLHGKTELGRMLSHFYKSPFHHPYFGSFTSMEGFWHYIKNLNSNDDHNHPRDALRSLSGNAAKQYGKKLKWSYVDQFQKIISAANFYKIEQNIEMKELFIDSTLPFDQYYLTKSTGEVEGQYGVVARLANYKWLIDSFEENRILLQYNERPVVINYEDIFNKIKHH